MSSRFNGTRLSAATDMNTTSARALHGIVVATRTFVGRRGGVKKENFLHAVDCGLLYDRHEGRTVPIQGKLTHIP